MLARRFYSMACQIVNSAVNGPVEAKIVNKLLALNPSSIKMRNDSHKHSHHAGMRGATNVQESHFYVEIVSGQFAGKALPMRHRMVYKLLAQEMTEDGVHALQLKTKTEEEMAKQ